MEERFQFVQVDAVYYINENDVESEQNCTVKKYYWFNFKKKSSLVALKF